MAHITMLTFPLFIFYTVFSWPFFYYSGYAWFLNLGISQDSSLNPFLVSFCIPSLGHIIYNLAVTYTFILSILLILSATLMTPSLSKIQSLGPTLNLSIQFPSDITPGHQRLNKAKKTLSIFLTNVHPPICLILVSCTIVQPLVQVPNLVIILTAPITRFIG